MKMGSAIKHTFKKHGLNKDVYGLLYPEVKRLLYKPPFYLNDFDLRWNKNPEEDIYNFVNSWVKFAGPCIGNRFTSIYEHFYPTAGSSEAIRMAISDISVRNMALCKNGLPEASIHVFSGEYGGYIDYAHNSMVNIVQHDRDEWDSVHTNIDENDVFFISEPSSLDGNFWENFDKFCINLKEHKPNVKIYVDLAYVGATISAKKLNLNHKNIYMIFMSLSKVFGVYNLRIGGCFTREPQISMEDKNHSINIFSLKVGANFLDAYGLCQLPSSYEKNGNDFIAIINSHYDINFKPSDVLFIASYKRDGAEKEDIFKEFYRKNLIRICLTPGLHNLIY